MTYQKLKPARSLQRLQNTMRAAPGDRDTKIIMSGQVPGDLATDEAKQMYLWRYEVEALEDTRCDLAQDLRFEYMERKAIEDATWHFVCQASLQRSDNHVPAFVAEHAHEPMESTCYFPIEDLTVAETTEVFGATFHPPEDVDAPTRFIGPDLPKVDSVIAVPCVGTSYVNMRERALVPARHALRLARIGLREHRGVGDQQLLFRLGVAYWFSDGASGWKSRGNESYGFALNEHTLPVATSPAVATLPAEHGTDVEQRTRRAVEWFEHSQLTLDSTVQIIHLFSALEAILGDHEPGIKATRLAVRRALLSEMLGRGFRDPMHVWLLYDRVRSNAVHGEHLPAVDRDELIKFAGDTRRAINEFLEYARREKMSERSEVCAVLDADERRGEVEGFIFPT